MFMWNIIHNTRNIIRNVWSRKKAKNLVYHIIDKPVILKIRNKNGKVKQRSEKKKIGL